jgi:hypothetical protein
MKDLSKTVNLSKYKTNKKYNKWERLDAFINKFLLQMNLDTMNPELYLSFKRYVFETNDNLNENDIDSLWIPLINYGFPIIYSLSNLKQIPFVFKTFHVIEYNNDNLSAVIKITDENNYGFEIVFSVKLKKFSTINVSENRLVKISAQRPDNEIIKSVLNNSVNRLLYYSREYDLPSIIVTDDSTEKTTINTYMNLKTLKVPTLLSFHICFKTAEFDLTMA